MSKGVSWPQTPHRLAWTRCPFYSPNSSVGQSLSINDGVQPMLEKLVLTGEEPAAPEGSRGVLTELADRLSTAYRRSPELASPWHWPCLDTYRIWPCRVFGALEDPVALLTVNLLGKEASMYAPPVQFNDRIGLDVVKPGWISESADVCGDQYDPPPIGGVQESARPHLSRLRTRMGEKERLKRPYAGE